MTESKGYTSVKSQNKIGESGDIHEHMETFRATDHCKRNLFFSEISQNPKESLMKFFRTLWILIPMVTLAGCGQGNAPLPIKETPTSSENQLQNTDRPIELTPLATLTSSPRGIPDPSTEGNAMPDPSDPVLLKLIETAIEDLANRLSVPADQIELREAVEVIWSDSSLGCPNPASLYTQVLIPGYLIRLQNRDSFFEYHAGKTGAAFYCPNPKPPHDILQSE